MKKILSLFTIVAVIFSMFAITVSADDTVFDLDVEFASETIEVGADGASTLTITFKPNFDASDEPICAGEFFFTPVGFEIVGVNSVQGTGLAASAWATYAADGYSVLGWASSTEGEGIVTDYKVVLDITVDTSAAKELSIEVEPGDYSYAGSVYGTYYVIPGTLEITKACEVKAAGPSIATVATSEAVLTTPKEAMVEKGQAVAMTFAAADLRDFAGMNWELTFADAAKKYAKVEYPAATIASLGDAAPVQFVAAFRVKANGGVENAITSIAAGFCNANKELAGITAAVNAR